MAIFNCNACGLTMAVGQNVCLRLTTRGDAPGYDEDGLWPNESMVFDQKDNRYTAT